MLDHLGVQVADVDASLDFYLRTFAPIGLRELMRYPVGNSFVVGLGGPDGHPDLWLSAGPGVETREVHLALRAPDRAAVDAVHEVAVAAGAEVLHARASGRSTTPATTASSCATPTATTWRPYTTAADARATGEVARPTWRPLVLRNRCV